jgi:hypothetical protein
MTDVTTGRLTAGPTADERDARLSEGASSLVGGGGSPLRNPQLLLAVSATLMTVGIVAIVLAWIGIARSTMVEEQLAYLVSGGLLGLALTTIGALTFFSHWLTVLVRSNHEQTAILRELRDQEAARQAAAAPSTRRAPRAKAG